MGPKVALSLTKKDFKEYATFAKDTGFDGIDYKASLIDVFSSPKNIIATAKRVGIPILSLHQPRWLIPYTPPFLFSPMLRLATYFPDIRITNHHLSGVKNLLALSNLNILRYILLAKKYSIPYTFESNPVKWVTVFFPTATYKPEAFAQLAEEQHFPMTLDISHIAAHGVDIVDFFEQHHAKIALIHMSDFKNGIGHLPLGKGDLPIKKLLQAIKRNKWNKLIVFEIKSFAAGIQEEKKKQQIAESLQFVKNTLRDS